MSSKFKTYQIIELSNFFRSNIGWKELKETRLKMKCDL
jgi:hypothetical protein